MITIDIETKSDKDIAKCGVYAYADSTYFDILLFAYSVDGQPVQVVDTANGEEIPENILAALADKNVIKSHETHKFYSITHQKTEYAKTIFQLAHWIYPLWTKLETVEEKPKRKKIFGIF